MTILNLTQHKATEEQVEAGVVEPSNKTDVQELLTFHEMPTKTEMVERAVALADIVVSEGSEYAMIGGAPYFMGTLEKILKDNNVKPLYAYSERESVEETLPDGTVKKVNVFKHKGFIEG